MSTFGVDPIKALFNGVIPIEHCNRKNQIHFIDSNLNYEEAIFY